MSAVEAKLLAWESLYLRMSDAERKLRALQAGTDALAARSLQEQIDRLRRESNAALDAVDEAFGRRVILEG